MQRGPTEKVFVGLGSRVRADLQQICPGQSEPLWQLFWQVLLHTPSQQSSPAVVLQSRDRVQAFGQAA